MATNTVENSSRSVANTDRGPSHSIWGDCPVQEIREDFGKGLLFEDDFLNFADHVSDQDTQQYASYIDTGVTIKQLAAVFGGQAEIAGNDADNDEGVLSGHGPMLQISDTAGDAYKTYFEARVSKADVADNGLAMFIGLAFDNGDGVPVSKTLALTDNDGAIGAFSYIGFHVDQANADALDFIYAAEGQTAQVAIAGVQALVAATWYKLGFLYDPAAPAAKRIRIFVNGVEQSTYVTATNIAAATFPDAEWLTPVWVTKVGTAAEVKAQMDWWRVAQVF